MGLLSATFEKSLRKHIKLPAELTATTSVILRGYWVGQGKDLRNRSVDDDSVSLLQAL